jgi:TDG/mug DNA glycosylase family protein
MIGHQTWEDRMGVQVMTLADLIPANLRAICVGIDPSPVSVAAGHYYQGQLGRRIFARLRQAGLLSEHNGSYEDDAAFLSGVGFQPQAAAATNQAPAATSLTENILNCR